MKQIYTLKPMVLARLCAEASVLAILVLLPLGTLCVPQLQGLALMPRVAIYVLSALALVILPFYGFLTWRITADDRGLGTISLFKRQFVEWEKLEKLSFQRTFTWRRYLVDFEGGQLTFPIWLNGVRELVQVIRGHLPAKAAAASGQREFKQGKLGLIFQFFRVLLGFGFLAVFWLFYASVSQTRSINAGDSALVLIVCLLATLLIGWRSLVVALVPRSIELTDGGVIIRTCFFERKLDWAEVRKLTPSHFMLPDGLMLKTRAGSFLITEDLEAVDELEEAINARLKASV